MPTIREIAKLANVSRGTVDKVLNHRPGVKDETRKRVETIIKELNYKPNPLGRALVNSRIITKIGVVILQAHNQFIQVTLDGIRAAADSLKPYGIEVITRMSSMLDPAEQLNILYTLQEEGVKNIALFPLDDPSIINYANQLIADGTSMITFNSDLKKINRLWFIGQNHIKGGRTAAELFENILPEGGEIGTIISSDYLACHQDRLQGFQERLGESHKPFQIIGVEPNQDTKERAFQITMDYLSSHPKLKAIYITGGGVAGIASALQMTGKTRKVKVICHDLLPISRELLQNGVVDYVIDQGAYEQGRLIVSTLYDYYNMRQIPVPNVCSIPIHIRSKESLE